MSDGEMQMLREWLGRVERKLDDVLERTFALESRTAVLEERSATPRRQRTWKIGAILGSSGLGLLGLWELLGKIVDHWKTP